MAIKKAVLCAALTGGLVLGAAACSSSSGSTAGSGTSGSASSGTSGSAGKNFTIAFVPGNSTDPFFLSMEAAGQAEATKLGMGFTVQAAATYSPETQQPILAAILARHPSALIVAPTDPDALNGTLSQYHAADIPIITVDTTISNASLLTSRITSDNAQGGAAAADSCAAAMKGTGSAAVIYTTPGTTTTNARGQAFISEMKAKHPNVTVYSEFDNNAESTATTQVSALILAHPNLGCVFGTNDYAAEGAATAVGTAHAQSRVDIAGYDAEPQLVSLLKNKTISIIIAQKPALELQMAVEYAHDVLTGKSSSVKSFVQLPNVTMTSANINEPSISEWIYK